VVGKTLGHYEILEPLGAGGMGEVYRARDTRLKRDVAVKTLPSEVATDPQRLGRLEREAQLLAQLDHPNIAAIYGLEKAPLQRGVAPIHFLVMQLVEGQTLASRFAKGRVETCELLEIALQLADALVHAHERGVVHRDLKSANVMIDPQGRVKVLDFGLAEHVPKELETTTASRTTLADAGAIGGTLPYMAPELLRGRPADSRTDIYALGVLLYEAAAGSLPFTADTGFELSSMILRDAPLPLPEDVPPSMRSLIFRCLEKAPGERFQDATELRGGLHEAGGLARTGRATEAHLGGELRAIAVLPLANLSGDPEQEYFADGMTEALITDLAKIGALKVISRTSAMHYKGSDLPLPDIARALGVDTIVEGSVMRAGDRVRVTAQLIRAATDTHLWAESYERDLSNILSLQSEVARAVAREVEAKLTPQEEAQLTGKPTVNPAAHEAYLKGRYLWNQRGLGLEKSIRFFEQALAEDSSYAPAHSGLADAYALLGFYGYRPPRQVMLKAKESAIRALELDPTLAEAHSSLGFVRSIYDWDLEGAHRDFQRAFELNPNYGPAIYWYTNLHIAWGRPLDGVAELWRGLEYDPLNVYMQAHLGTLFMAARDYVQASTEFTKALELDKDFYNARANLGTCYLYLSRVEEGLGELRRAADSAGRQQWALGFLGAGYASAGERDKAVEVVDQLKERRESEYVSALYVAAIHALLGDKDEAFEWLEKAYDERAPLLVSFHRLPYKWLDSLREDPRFDDLRQRMEMTDEQPANR